MTIAAVALGSNLGDREHTLCSAVDAMQALSGTRVLRVSTFIETEPVGPGEQGPYLNGACLLETSLGADALLRALLEIERQHGRERAQEERWGPRTLDLDLLLFGEEQIQRPGLHVPHPRLHERDFVLIPLAEIAPELLVPCRRQTVQQMLERLSPPGADPCT